jgi:hypothetical protein
MALIPGAATTDLRIFSMPDYRARKPIPRHDRFAATAGQFSVAVSPPLPAHFWYQLIM